ncbi:signal peptidase I [Coraliomargarita sp. SDUM461004]|uniref:Signal peptidase I n=1 Tax=Thalassobacterium sedimentorum TaxID=3041258 RepID=A0ABU1AGB6_9BACT|nr:signal peptidase I [Coraliomargarita sp. SDUM461004]MDQ8193830.1 signal peptidase I [Coraliomargarita sp. SDUM461004]
MSISKQKKAAKELLQAAHKVFHYRRDLISEARLAELDKAVGEVDGMIRDQSAKTEALAVAMDRLDALLRKIGGKMYPKTFWNDNLEVALVAAIIVIGIRTFFFQPFIIPTNSMYPTYSGMNAVLYEDKNDAPATLTKTFRFLTLGARHKALVAQNSGDVQIPMAATHDGGMRIYFKQVKGKKWGILPAVLAEYTILVGGVPHSIRVPADFDMQSTLLDSFEGVEPELIRTSGGTGYALDLHTQAQAGDSILRFDITLGDALFVDRISYHFKRPQAGDPFVFRTREIPGIEGGHDNIVDKYYIKRIAGVGGETIEIKDGALLVDGEPRDEVEAYGRNARQEGEYGGYVYPSENAASPAKLMTGPGVQANIPEGKFVALGDNSANSLDSRYWGYVPEKAVIGKAVFIYYPFTKRWGLAE